MRQGVARPETPRDRRERRFAGVNGMGKVVDALAGKPGAQSLRFGHKLFVRQRFDLGLDCLDLGRAQHSPHQ